MPDPVIVADRLTLSRGGRAVLTGVDLTVQAGRVTGLVGPNGVGKSSLLAAAGGLLAYQGGSLRVGGREVADDPRAARRAARTASWPSPANHALTGAAYLAFLRAHRRDAWRADTAEAAAEASDLAPHLGRPITTYSHGTLAKLSLVAALGFEAETYLLDEALNGLDHRATTRLSALLRAEAAAGRAVVVASHALAVLHRLCDDVVVLTGQGSQAVLPGGPAGGDEATIEAALEAAYDA